MIKRVIGKILQTSRVAEYEEVLQHARKQGYILCSLKDWYTKYRDTEEKVLILRHDVDYDTDGAFRFFQLEKQLGATSSFYFRWKTMSSPIMHEMYQNNFEVSLHFETLATYAKKYHLLKKSDINDRIIESCQAILSDEIKRFEQTYFKIYSICSHGDKRNRILDTPNHVIVDYKFKAKHKILFETYDANILSAFDAYISDSSIYSSFEWKHSGTPCKMIDEKKQTICLLTHPIHWNQSFFKNIRMLFAIYSDNR